MRYINLEQDGQTNRLTPHLQDILRQTGGQQSLPLLDTLHLVVGGQDEALNIAPKPLCHLTPGLLLRGLLLGSWSVMLLGLNNLLDIVFLNQETGLAEQAGRERYCCTFVEENRGTLCVHMFQHFI